jgi:glycosyltransferase involved in cell wall biosynthesis
MPISLLEAMAYGLPAITRPVAAVRDFFEEGKMGILVESLDPADYANALERLLTDRELRFKIGTYNHDYARNRFRAQEVARNMLQLYQDISPL